MLVQLPPTDNSMMNVVSRIIMTAMPSTPSVKRTPHDGIHGMSITDCHAAFAGSKLHHKPIETTNSIANVSSAMPRGLDAVPFTTSSPSAALRRAPWNQITAAPASGTIRSTGRIQRWYPIEARKAFMSLIPPLPKAEGAENGEDTEGETTRVGTELPRLQLRANPSDEASQVGAAIDAEAVDQAGIDAAPQHAARNADDGLYDRVVVDLVHVILVEQDPLEAFLLRGFALRHQRRRLEPDDRRRDTRDRDEHGKRNEPVLEPWRRLRRAGDDKLRRLTDYRIEPMIEKADFADRYQLREIQPTTEGGEHAKHDERSGHHPRRLVQ